ncbi:SET domain containing protein [Hyaloscypha variabilis]|uniref:SET domain-containing protein n=1 Tax=Hyaloscypha variabilis (strain UAMH 11265 / GT02V1 / F) TaxID=1149755 RepID=A0A2J6SDB3_HYAVF|nr:SET domain-containing protein [Hyaloscypha variabilis F]
MEGKKEFAEEERRCHFCQIRAFAIAQKPHCYTLAITNDVDDEWISLDFRFIEKCVLGQGVKESLAPHGYRVGCECKRDEDCATQCLCLDDLDPDNIINPKYKNAYYTAGERKGLLRYEILELSSDEIYECSDLCGCSMDCPNRVVGRGRKFNIEIFKTKDGRGFGVRAREDIRKGQFIDRYVGEIITPEEANRRRDTAKYRKDLYLFALDKFNHSQSDEQRFRGEPYEVDGEFMAGPTRFINHSCQPNLRVMAVVTDRANKHLHELCFFALEDIPRFTELTFDYVAGTSTAGDNATVAKEAKERQAKGEFTQKCLCGAKKCRGFLW